MTSATVRPPRGAAGHRRASVLLLLVLALAALGVAWGPPSAAAQQSTGGTTAPKGTTPKAAVAAPPNTLGTTITRNGRATVTPAGPIDGNAVSSPPTRDQPPVGHRLTADQAQRIAERDPKVAKVRRDNKGSYVSIFLKGQTRWQLSLYRKNEKGRPLKEIGQVIVSDATGKVTESWTGPYVAWTMARGYDGAFGRSITNPWLWGVLLVLFLAPFVGRRPVRGPPVPFLLLAGFSVPLAAFNNARLDIAVPTSFLLLLGLLAWGLLRGLRKPRGEPRPLLPSVPLWGLVLVGLGLFVFRIVLNAVDGNVIDVGYAGVVGADKIIHGKELYGAFPKGIEAGDTYGPLNYLAYIPAGLIWPWSGMWDDLPSAHASAILFDVLAVAVLYLVGRRQGADRDAGRARGVLYAYLWLACPWTAYCLNSNANDALVAVGLGLVLLLGGRPLGRGLAAGAAAAVKIGPVALLPMLATRRDVAPTVLREHGSPAWRSVPRSVVLFAGAAVLLALVSVLVVQHGGPLRAVYDRTIAYQAGRPAPFMPWGYYRDLGWGRDVARVLAVVLAVAVAVVPRRHDLAGTAALMAAVLVGLQVATEYWFYLYLTWLLPLIFVGALGDRPIRWREGLGPAAPARAYGPLPYEDSPWAGRTDEQPVAAGVGATPSPGSEPA